MKITTVETPYASTMRYPMDPELPNMSHVQCFPHSPDRMLLQIRTTGTITDHGDISYQILSNAPLDLDAAIRLHAGLELWIEEQTRKLEKAS